MCLEQDADGVWQSDVRHARARPRCDTRLPRQRASPTSCRSKAMGWDGIDELRARVAGWETGSIETLPFKHHRKLGAREDRWEKWVGQGRMSHYMGYRPTYLAARALFRSVREPRAVGMLWGFGAAALRREPRFATLPCARIFAISRASGRSRGGSSRHLAAPRPAGRAPGSAGRPRTRREGHATSTGRGRTRDRRGVSPLISVGR